MVSGTLMLYSCIANRRDKKRLMQHALLAEDAPAKEQSSTPEQPAVTRQTSPGEPPWPYRYDTFCEWLRTTNLEECLDDMSWVPPAEEFDLEFHSGQGKWSPLLMCEDSRAAIDAAKRVNKWLFMHEVMRTGRLVSMATPGMHLYILRALRPAAVGAQRRPTFVDAGCGTGYLLQAWVLMCGCETRAVGLELDEETATEASRTLADPEAICSSVSWPKGAQTEVHVCNALSPDLDKCGLREGEVDAINCGLAVEGMPVLRRLAKLLRVGGLMTVPLSLDEQPPGVPPDMCAASFRILRKEADGSLVPLPTCAAVPVRFTRGMILGNDCVPPTPADKPAPELSAKCSDISQDGALALSAEAGTSTWAKLRAAPYVLGLFKDRKAAREEEARDVMAALRQRNGMLLEDTEPAGAGGLTSGGGTGGGGSAAAADVPAQIGQATGSMRSSSGWLRNSLSLPRGVSSLSVRTADDGPAAITDAQIESSRRLSGRLRTPAGVGATPLPSGRSRRSSIGGGKSGKWLCEANPLASPSSVVPTAEHREARLRSLVGDAAVYSDVWL